MSELRAVALRGAAAALAVVAIVGVPPLRAQTCTVPGSHATIQEAADDPACAEVDLAA